MCDMLDEDQSHRQLERLTSYTAEHLSQEVNGAVLERREIELSLDEQDLVDLSLASEESAHISSVNLLDASHLLTHDILTSSCVHLLHVLAELLELGLVDVLIQPFFVFWYVEVLLLLMHHHHRWSFDVPLDVHYIIWIMNIVVSPESLRSNAVLVLVKALLM